jgi:hypothetical protein
MVLIQESTLTSIANALRGKLGITSRISPSDFPVRILQIPQTVTGFDMNVTNVTYSSTPQINAGSIAQNYNDMSIVITEG